MSPEIKKHLEGVIRCPDFEQIIMKRVCRDKRLAALHVKRRDEAAGKIPDLSPCCICEKGREVAGEPPDPDSHVSDPFATFLPEEETKPPERETEAGNPESIRMNPETIKTIKETPMPKTRKEIAQSCYKDGICRICGQNRRIFVQTEVCGSCVRSGKFRKGKSPAVDIPPVATLREPSKSESDLTVVIPPELRASLCALASENVRTPQEQVIFLVKMIVAARYAEIPMPPPLVMGFQDARRLP